jgi:hypothetical protein
MRKASDFTLLRAALKAISIDYGLFPVPLFIICCSAVFQGSQTILIFGADKPAE